MPTTYAIPDGRTVMAATLYTGTGANRSVSNAVNGVGFQPDLVWMKARSAANSHYLANSVMGVGFGLISDSTGAQQTVTAGKDLTSFDATGFSLGPEQTFGSSNTNGTSIVAWQWNAGGSTVTNTSGSISAQVRANATAGFSVVTWTGAGSAGTIGHGLGVTPSMIIIKNRTGTQFWFVNHTSISATQNLYLNATDSTQSDGVFTSRGATTFGVGTAVADSGINYVAYCFAAVAGYSAFGSYTGNGSADGPFVYLGFRPRFVMVKCSSSNQGGNAVWGMFDTARNISNVTNNRLIADLSNSESTDSWLDINSNGFKIRNTTSSLNASGATYIYMAFAENPLKYANAR